MLFPSPLLSGTLTKRYKRFLADIVLADGREITAHCANPGSMMGVAIPGAPVWVSEHHGKGRKLPYSWALTKIGDTLIPINTSNPNKIAHEAIEAGVIGALNGYETIRREVKYGASSRIDLLLENGLDGARACYVEVKNVHLSRAPGLAEFPDSVTARGAKHLAELSQVARTGGRAVMLFIAQRSDCVRFRPAADLDPAYAKALKAAMAAGVEILCYDCDVSLSAVVLRKPLELELD